MRNSILIFSLLIGCALRAQFAPPAGQPGTLAVHKDSSAFVAWAQTCAVQRGFQNIADTTLGRASLGDANMALGRAQQQGTVSLGDGGMATLVFQPPIRNGQGFDFAVFENAFLETFLELAFVEVSSDGLHFVRFPATSLTQDSVQIDGFGAVDATKIHNLAGKYIAGFGTPFDLEDLRDSLGVDLEAITHIRIIDVVGSINPQYATFDHLGNPINDPWPTPFPSAGFDLDAVGVVHQQGLATPSYAAAPALELFPNPAATATRLRWNRPNATSMQYQVVAANGQSLASGNWTPAGFGAELPLGNIVSATAGLKIVQVTTAQEHFTFKIF